MTVAVSEAYNTAFEARLSASLGVTFTARPDTTGGREPVREITGVPSSMIEFFSRGGPRSRPGTPTWCASTGRRTGTTRTRSASYQLARQANLDTRQGKKPPRSLADKREAWREELRAAFGARRGRRS